MLPNTLGFNYFISLMPMIVPSEAPATAHRTPFVVKPVMCPRKVLNTESKN